MKAKHFKKLRQQLKWFLVRESDGLFGSFEAGEWRYTFPNAYHCVLAYSALNAVERAQRRGIGKGRGVRLGIDEDFAYWKVKEYGKENSKRTVSYF